LLFGRLQQEIGCRRSLCDNLMTIGYNRPGFRQRTQHYDDMSEQGSVSIWIQQLKAGDVDVAQELWERYHRRLVGLAHKKLGGAPRRAIDEEDAVQSAFHSFFERTRAGQFPQLADRDDLWRLLVVITARKTINQRAHENRAKRGGGMVHGQAILDGANSDSDGMAQVIGSEPTPEFAAQVAEELDQLLGQLPDPTHREVVSWKLEGYTNPEIAKKLGCSLSSVERKLRLIRQKFETELEQTGGCGDF